MATKKRRIYWATLLLSWICCLLTGCAGVQRETAMTVEISTGTAPAYTQVLHAAVLDRAIHTAPSGVLFSLRNGQAALAYDAQAQGILEAGAAEYWYPIARATAVIAVNRELVDEPVDGWQTLTQLDASISLQGTEDKELLLCAMAYGLEGEDFSLDSAIALLQRLRREGHLKENDAAAPIQICFDETAATRIEADENWEIIVPREGTLCYTRGILSRMPLQLAEDTETLAREAGLRPVQGAGEETLYPAEGNYVVAVSLKDYSHLQHVQKDITRRLRREVWQTRLYTTADGREHSLAALGFICIVLIWGASVLRRVMQRGIRIAVLAECAFIIGWVLLRHFKYQITVSGTLSRYCWYGYYFFQTGLPLVLLWIAWMVGQGEVNAAPPRWLRACTWLDAALVALVFTNDLHNLVFRLDLSSSGWTDVYGYGSGYFLALGVMIAHVAIALGILWEKAWHSPRRWKRGLPLLWCLLMLAYGLGYVAGIPVARQSDFTVTFCLLAILFFETVMHAGLIPVNTRYRALFAHTSAALQIVDGQRVLLASRRAPHLDGALFARLQAENPVSLDADTVLYSARIAGGWVVWQRDISALKKLQQEEMYTAERLKASNRLLAEQQQRGKETARDRAQSELMQRLERQTDKKMRGLQSIADTLSDAPDRTQLTVLTLLLCCIKRRLDFSFRQCENADVPSDELAVYLQELAGLAEYAGVRAMVLCATSCSLSVSRALVCYECFYETMAWASGRGRGTVLCRLPQPGEGTVMALLMASYDKDFSPPSLLESTAASVGLRLTVKKLEDGVGVELAMPKGGGE